VLFNLALLFFFKYWDFLAESLAAVGLDFMPRLGLSLPIGISFYTFQTMSYTIDVYRGDAPVQRSEISFHPRYAFPSSLPALSSSTRTWTRSRTTGHTAEKFAPACRSLWWVWPEGDVANTWDAWDAYMAVPAAGLTVLGAWLGVAAFLLQITLTSPLPDMAIGLGRMLGFEFKPNFDYPIYPEHHRVLAAVEHSLGTGSGVRSTSPGGNRVSRGRCASTCWCVGPDRHLARGELDFLLWGLYFGCSLCWKSCF
jgi:alginate O-acetyltransferase complex protein AlgI